MNVLKGTNQEEYFCRVYLFHGSLDDLVDPELSQRMADFFEAFMPSEQVAKYFRKYANEWEKSSISADPCG